LILDVYIWWAEGVHLRPQPQRQRGMRHWSPAFFNELLEYAMPFDPQTDSQPVRSTALDAHLGDALMQITATVYAEMKDVGRESDPDTSLRIKYRKIGAQVRFVPGGEGFFNELRARINSAGWWFNFPAGAILPYVSLVPARLASADLKGSFLAGADLPNADLESADLSLASLWGANLRGANLRGANLRAAYLLGADLTGANLTEANLTEANLTQSHLRGANLTGANLRRTVLTGAELTHANLIDADLTDAQFDGRRPGPSTRFREA